MWKVPGASALISNRSARCARLAVAFVGVASTASAETYVPHQSSTGFALPGVQRPSGFDEVRASDGTTCRSAMGNGGAYVDVGAVGNQNDGSLTSGSVYGRVVMPMGERPGRVDCKRLYELEVKRLEMEVELLRSGLGAGARPVASARPTFPAGAFSGTPSSGVAATVTVAPAEPAGRAVPTADPAPTNATPPGPTIVSSASAASFRALPAMAPLARDRPATARLLAPDLPRAGTRLASLTTTFVPTPFMRPLADAPKARLPRPAKIVARLPSASDEPSRLAYGGLDTSDGGTGIDRYGTESGETAMGGPYVLPDVMSDERIAPDEAPAQVGEPAAQNPWFPFASN